MKFKKTEKNVKYKSALQFTYDLSINNKIPFLGVQSMAIVIFYDRTSKKTRVTQLQTIQKTVMKTWFAEAK